MVVRFALLTGNLTLLWALVSYGTQPCSHLTVSIAIDVILLAMATAEPYRGRRIVTIANSLRPWRRHVVCDTTLGSESHITLGQERVHGFMVPSVANSLDTCWLRSLSWAELEFGGNVTGRSVGSISCPVDVA